LISWYEDQQKLTEENWKNGKQDGFCISWYNNGIKKLEGIYKDRKKKDFGFIGMKMETKNQNQIGKMKKKRRTLDLLV